MYLSSGIVCEHLMCLCGGPMILQHGSFVVGPLPNPLWSFYSITLNAMQVPG